MTSGWLITHGHVYDGSGDSPHEANVRICGQTITKIGHDLPTDDDQIVDASGLIVTPGLIDLHTHVYSGMGIDSIDPQQAGL